jgi:hypothetical protein
MTVYYYSDMTERDAHVKGCHAQWSEWHAKRRAAEELRAKRDAWHDKVAARNAIKLKFRGERTQATSAHATRMAEIYTREHAELAALEAPQ